MGWRGGGPEWALQTHARTVRAAASASAAGGRARPCRQGSRQGRRAWQGARGPSGSLLQLPPPPHPPPPQGAAAAARLAPRCPPRLRAAAAARQSARPPRLRGARPARGPLQGRRRAARPPKARGRSRRGSRGRRATAGGPQRGRGGRARRAGSPGRHATRPAAPALEEEREGCWHGASPCAARCSRR